MLIKKKKKEEPPSKCTVEFFLGSLNNKRTLMGKTGEIPIKSVVSLKKKKKKRRTLFALFTFAMVDNIIGSIILLNVNLYDLTIFILRTALTR